MGFVNIFIFNAPIYGDIYGVNCGENNEACQGVHARQPDSGAEEADGEEVFESDAEEEEVEDPASDFESNTDPNEESSDEVDERDELLPDLMPIPLPVLVPEQSLYGYRFGPDDDQICRDGFLAIENMHQETLDDDAENKAELESLYNSILSAFENSGMQIVNNSDFLIWLLSFS